MNFRGRTLNARKSTTVLATASNATLLTSDSSSCWNLNCPMKPANTREECDADGGDKQGTLSVKGWREAGREAGREGGREECTRLLHDDANAVLSNLSERRRSGIHQVVSEVLRLGH
jgi:hypothetical protein